MYLEKIFEVTLTINNPINFCADKAKHLMIELSDRYAGHSFKGAFIVRIIEVLRCSDCFLQMTNTSEKGSIDVEFRAEVKVFSQWDLLIGVKICKTQPALIGYYGHNHGEKNAQTGTGRAVVSIMDMKSRVAEIAAVGQILPIRILGVFHTPMEKDVAIAGVLLRCDTRAPSFLLHGALGPSASVELKPMLEAIDLELEQRTAIVHAKEKGKADDLWFFERLLYTYRAPLDSGSADKQSVSTGEGKPVWYGPPALLAVAENEEIRNVVEIARRVVQGETVSVSGVWSRSLALYRSSPFATRANATGGPLVTDSTPKVVFAEFLKNILDYLGATREMVEIYSDRQVKDAHLGVWTAMRSMQVPLPS